MKKIILLLLPFIVLMFGSRSLAYTAPDGNDYQNYYHVVAVAGTFDIYCDNYLVASQEAMESTVYKLLYPFASENNSAYGLYQISSRYQSYRPSYNFEYGQNRDGEVLYNICLSQNGSTPQINSYLYCTAAELQAAGITIYSTNADALQNSISNNIDFSNVVYDPMVATPDFSVFYTDDTSTLPRFPAEIQLNNASENYFIQIQIENLLPSVVAIGNDYSYAVMRYYQPQSHFIYDTSDLILSTNATSALISGLASQYWRSDVNGFNDVEFVTPNSVPDNFESTPSYIFATSLYESTYSKIALFYGNVSTISMRYFVVRDDVVYGGKVRSWTNLNNVGFKDSIPDYYVPYQIAQGYENDNTGDIVPVETSTPYVDIPSNQFGKKTGFNININVGSNVPNYPDYPTIATYNTDNLLVEALDTAKQLPDFFTSSIAIFNGMFGGLLPEPFWGIIMTGFLFSIVIMIIKVL